jgi:hypothetical protein
MAIDYTGKVTTTGMMNKSPGANIQAPNMSNLAPPKKPTQPTQPTQPIRQPIEQPVETAARSNTITDEDMAILEPVLSPSVKQVLSKIAPNIENILSGAGINEEVVALPISVATNFAIKNYGGTEEQAINAFITDLSNTQMDTNNVPLDTASNATGMMARQEPEIPQTPEEGTDYDQIDGIGPEIA